MLDVGILQGHWLAFAHHLVAAKQRTIAKLVDNPKQGKHAQGPHKRRHKRDAMERRNKPKATNANEEHKQSLPTRENGVIAAIRGYVLHKTQTMGKVLITSKVMVTNAVRHGRKTAEA